MSLIEAEPTTTRAAESRLDEPPASSCDPTTEELSALTMMERFAFRFARRMNRGRAKVFWTWCQRTLGAGWIHLSTYNIMRVYGLEHLEAVSHERPVLLVANHRSFFDMYVVSTVLFTAPSFPKNFSSLCAGASFINRRWGCSSISSWVGGQCFRRSL